MRIEVALSSEHPRTLKLKGRMAWAMVELANAGPTGVTPIKRPAPRWSGYVFDLRALGVPIKTIMEPHDGNFPGQHARYVLTCGASVQLLDGEA